MTDHWDDDEEDADDEDSGYSAEPRDPILTLMRSWWDVDDAIRQRRVVFEARQHIDAQLIELGIEIYEGEKEDEGWLLGRKMEREHGPDCKLEDRSHGIGEHEVFVCHCEPDYRVWRRPGFENGVGKLQEVTVYTAREVDPSEIRNCLGRMAPALTMASYNGKYFVHDAVGTNHEWVGPHPKRSATYTGGR